MKGFAKLLACLPNGAPQAIIGLAVLIALVGTVFGVSCFPRTFLVVVGGGSFLAWGYFTGSILWDMIKTKYLK